MLVINKVRSESSRQSIQPSSTLKHFRRLLGYVGRHRRYVVPAVGCILLMALAYSFSIGSVLPILTVLVRPQGLHGSVDQFIAQKRYNCEFVIYSRLRHRPVEDVPDGVARLRTIGPGSPQS